MLRLTSLLALALLLFSGPAVLAESEPAAETTGSDAFVDLDGDGINDNALDIRDGFFIEEEPEESSLGGQSFDAFSNVATETEIELPLTCREKFVQRKFNARGQSKNRCDLEADFGATSGGGSSSGSTCIGGMCF